MKTRPPLTKKRKTWAESRGGATFKGAPLRIPAGVADRYAAELERLVRRMSAEYQRELRHAFEHPDAEEHMELVRAADANIASQTRMITNKLARKFQAMFDRKARDLADRMVKQVDKASKTSLHTSLKDVSGGLSLKTSSLSAVAVTTLKASVTENVALIKSIPQQYASKVQQAVMRSITTGGGLEYLAPELEKIGGITERRAKNIAHDQTSKAYSALNRDRMKSLGIRQFEWLHSGGGQHPRRLHEEMSGRVYSFDDPPIIDERTGERGVPGQAINCKCVAVPVISFEPGEGEEDE